MDNAEREQNRIPRPDGVCGRSLMPNSGCCTWTYSCADRHDHSLFGIPIRRIRSGASPIRNDQIADYARAVARLTWRLLARRAPDSERLHAARRVSSQWGIDRRRPHPRATRSSAPAATRTWSSPWTPPNQARRPSGACTSWPAGRSGHRPRSARTLPPSAVDQLPRSAVGTMLIGAATVISRGDHRSIALRWPGHSRDQLSSSRTRGMTCWPYSSMLVMSWSCVRPGMPYFRSNRVAPRVRRFVAIFWATVSGDPT